MVTAKQFEALCSLVNRSIDGSVLAKRVLIDVLVKSDYLSIPAEILFGPEVSNREFIFAAIRDMINEADGVTHLNTALTAMNVSLRFRVFWTENVLHIALELIDSSSATEPVSINPRASYQGDAECFTADLMGGDA